MSIITTGRTATAQGATDDYAPGRGSRAWAFTGLAAGAIGLAGVALSMTLGGVYDPTISGDAEKIADSVGEQVPLLLAFHTAFTICTVLLIVFAAGLHRRLAAQAPAGSLLPGVAAGGIGLTAVATLMGTGLDTEFIFGAQLKESERVAESVVFFSHWVGTIPWLWLGAGVAALAVAVAALRHAAAPRWLGWVSLVLGGLTTLVGISPLQYMAGFVGPVWLVIAGLGFAFGDRASRARVTA